MQNRVGDLLEALATCLCATITAEEQPETCFCGVIPGDGVVASYGSDCEEKNGIAWVRLTNAYAATGTAAPDFTAGNCGKLLGFDIEVGILRAVPVGDVNGEGPSDAQLLEMTNQQLMDMQVMRKAITCCDALDPKDFMLGNYTPGGPMGQMLGGTWALSVAI